MYRAMIVEDEDLMRDYLTARLHELCPEWEAAAAASDGLEAADKLTRERFDAVITDIRMPGMDGLELAKTIRQQDKEMPILIITGYDEFNYARSAVRLNVFDYLLKPINEDELAVALSAMAAQIAQRREAQRKDRWLAALEGDFSARRELETSLTGRSAGLLLLGSSKLLMARDDGSLRRAAQDAGVQAARIGERMALLCTAGDPQALRAAMRRAAEQARAECPEIIGVGVALASADMTDLLSKAVELWQAAFLTKAPFLFFPLTNEQQALIGRFQRMRDTLNEALAAGMLSSDRRISISKAMNDFAPPYQKRAVLLLFLECEADISQRMELMKAFSASDEAPQAALEYGMQSLFSSPQIFQGSLAQRALEYLQEHFREAISLTAVADAMGVTPAYLSAVFHREIGLSYSQTLLKMRMEEAARQLRALPAMRVSDIAERIGFPSSKHFIHVFGQYYHMTPGEYRSKSGETKAAL